MTTQRLFLMSLSTTLLSLLLSLSAVAQTPDVPVEFLVPEIINQYPHDDTAFTQGLLFDGGRLYESTGTYGGSTVREVDYETGAVLREQPVDAAYFAEGMTRVGDRLIQLTWQEETAFVYDFNSLELMDSYSYEGEGWGLCYDERYLFMSNGSHFLAIRDPETFELVFNGAVTFNMQTLNALGTQNGLPLSRLNELECVGDLIYANVYQTDYILRISKLDGRVTGVIDASGLLPPETRATLEAGREVLNGIAYRPDTDTFLITGKNWPSLFEVRFVPMPTAETSQ